MVDDNSGSAGLVLAIGKVYMAAAREMMQELELLLVEIDRVLDECRR